MRWISLLRDLCDPKPMNDIDMSVISMALNSPTVRNHWIDQVLSELRDLNLSVDELLDKQDTKKILEISARRAQTVKLLRQIEVSRNSVELEIHQNQGTDLDVVAVKQVPGL